MDEDPDSTEAKYLDVPTQEKDDALFLYGENQAKRKTNKEKSEKEERFKADKKSLEAAVASFGDPERDLSRMIEDRISVDDLREEVNKIRSSMEKLLDQKSELVSNGKEGFDKESIDRLPST